jgi:hypothetical protein
MPASNTGKNYAFVQAKILITNNAKGQSKLKDNINKSTEFIANI